MSLRLKVHQCIGEYDILIGETCNKRARSFDSDMNKISIKEFNDTATLPLHAEDDFKT